MINAKHKAILQKSAIPEEVADLIGILSIEREEDVPDGATELRSHVPGLLFPIPDVNNDLSYQIRADETPEGHGKYRLLSGPNFLMVWQTVPLVKAIFEQKMYESVLIVEGTKQSLAASIANNDTKTLVVGIAGCWGWRSIDSSTSVLPELEGVISGRDVIVCFDADISTNASVHQAAVELQKYIKSINPDNSVRWITKLGKAEEHTGLDDYLGSIRIPSKELVSLISKSKTSIPKLIQHGTPTQMSSGKVYADESQGAFVKAVVKDGELINTTEVYLGLIRVVKAIYTINKPVPPSMRDYSLSPSRKADRYVLEVTPQGEQSMQVEVSADVFFSPNLWARYFPSQNKAHAVEIPTTTSTARALVNAILNYRSDETEYEYEIPHLGWIMHNNEPFYVTSERSIGPSSTTTSVRMRVIENNASYVTVVDPDMLTDMEKQEVVKTTILARGLFHRPDLWSLMWGGLACSVGGIYPTGMLYVHGEPSSGKTYWAQAVTSALSPKFGPGKEAMENFRSTRIAIASAYPPFNNSMVLFDDAKPTTNKYDAQKVVDQLDDLARYAYSGEQRKVGSRNFDKNVTEVTQALPGRAMVVVTAENQPQVQSDHDSAIERMFIVNVGKADTMIEAGLAPKDFVAMYPRMADLGGADILEILGESGVLNRAISVYARWIAQKIQERYQSCTDTKTYTPILWWMQAEAKARLEPYLDLTAGRGTRLREVTSAFCIGWDLWTDFAVSIGAITPEEREQLIAEFRGEMARLIDDYVKRYGKGTNTPFTRIIDAVQGAVAAGRAELRMHHTNIHLPYNIPLIGKEVKIRDTGERYIALIPSELERLTGMTPFQLEAIFKSVKRVETGRPTTLSHGKVKTVRCFWIPMDLWNQQSANILEEEEEDDDDAENPLSELDF